jgi:hypothetical protein
VIELPPEISSLLTELRVRPQPVSIDNRDAIVAGIDGHDLHEVIARLARDTWHWHDVGWSVVLGMLDESQPHRLIAAPDLPQLDVVRLCRVGTHNSTIPNAWRRVEAVLRRIQERRAFSTYFAGS